ncbi:MAG: hypothetical protein SRB1_02699 [Desulfobacteraceae bacterium Eth-SRB1]|nr:MAG: hypothetical protein SRB1_02699 [Desulfobacteraceae bacterium Eth-SRB1]
MTAVSEAFNNNPDEVISLKSMLVNTDMHRLTFDRYMSKAINEGLMIKDIINRYGITPKGIEYLISHGIINA